MDVAAIVKSFEEIGVTKEQLIEKLGHPLATISAKERVSLQEFYKEKKPAEVSEEEKARLEVERQAAAHFALEEANRKALEATPPAEPDRTAPGEPVKSKTDKVLAKVTAKAAEGRAK